MIMTSNRSRFLRVSCLIVGILCAHASCAWRSQEAEHYFGPVMYRYVTPGSGKAYLSEQIHFPFLFETGDQWSFTIGLNRRLVASPIVIKKFRKGKVDSTLWKWTKPLALLPDPAEGEWGVSLIYLRGDGLKESNLFSRAQYGASMGFGNEARNLSLGVASKVELRPVQEGVYLLEYDSNRSNETRYEIWVDSFEQAYKTFHRGEGP